MTKQPPVSLRIPAELRAKVESFAEANKMAHNAAYVNLLWRALANEQRVEVSAHVAAGLREIKPTQGMQAAEIDGDRVTGIAGVQLGPTRPKPGAMLIDKRRKR